MAAVDNQSGNHSAVIDVVGLVKSFGRTKVLNKLNLNVASGEVHGFLGPNGAGKTTTLRVLLGLLRADAGALRLLGRDPWRDAVDLHRRLAYVPGDVSLWPTLTGGEVIDLWQASRGAGPQATGQLWGVPRWVMDVSPFAHSPVLPGPNAALMGIVWLTLVAGALLAIGSAAFRRRDLAS